MLDQIRILRRNEISAVLDDFRRRLRRRQAGGNTRLNLTIFRLSCCCGLRVKEICGLAVQDVVAAGDGTPFVRVPAAITKGHRHRRTGQVARRTRIVPLRWDEDTRQDLLAWREFRQSRGAGLDDPFVCGQSTANSGRPLKTSQVAKKWKSAIRALGPERVRQLSIHCGRHSFITHALYGGIPIIHVSRAAGHASIATTNAYAHLLDDVDVPGNIFRFDQSV
jgi:integrase